jgi:hypothetical protein
MCRMKTTPDTGQFRRVRAKMALLAACVSEAAICRVIVSGAAPNWRSGWGAACHKFPEVEGPEHGTTPSSYGGCGADKPRSRASQYEARIKGTK